MSRISIGFKINKDTKFIALKNALFNEISDSKYFLPMELHYILKEINNVNLKLKFLLEELDEKNFIVPLGSTSDIEITTRFDDTIFNFVKSNFKNVNIKNFEKIKNTFDPTTNSIDRDIRIYNKYIVFDVDLNVDATPIAPPGFPEDKTLKDLIDEFLNEVNTKLETYIEDQEYILDYWVKTFENISSTTSFENFIKITDNWSILFKTTFMEFTSCFGSYKYNRDNYLVIFRILQKNNLLKRFEDIIIKTIQYDKLNF